MTEELQQLIETLNNEVLGNAEQRAKEIVAEAQKKGEQIIVDAEQRATQIISKAQLDADAFTERGIKTLGHAGRDLLIKVKAGIERLLQSLVNEAVHETITPDVMKEMLVKISEAYFTQVADGKELHVLVGQQDHKTLVRFFADRYKKKLSSGVEIKLDPHIEKGFQVKIGDESAYHDFTTVAISEELAKLLKPVLADIVLRSALEQDRQKGSSAEQRAA